MTFKEAQELLISRQDYVKKDGFGRIYACLGRLGNPQNRLKAVHVTGTNGKGSVCALFEAAARAAGLKTGLFISPHLVSMTERIQVAGRNIPETEFADLLEEVSAAGPDLSFFELLTCMAFLHFARGGVQLAVVEVGIGGRYDTTNVLPKPELSVITSVDYDHTRYLGSTIAEIASQKAGIIKPGGICLAPLLPPEARIEISKEAAEKGAQCHFFAPAFEIAGRNWTENRLMLRYRKTGALLPYGILGEKQVSNATLVWEGIEILRGLGWPVTQAHAAAGFASVRWPARFQVLRAPRAFPAAVFVVDGAHNREAAAAFAATWKSSPFAAGDPSLVVGMMQDKDRTEVLRQLAPLAGRFVLTRPESPRSADPCALADELSALRPEAETEVQDDILAALAAAASRGGPAAVVGSFYLAGSALELLAREREVKCSE